MYVTAARRQALIAAVSNLLPTMFMTRVSGSHPGFDRAEGMLDHLAPAGMACGFWSTEHLLGLSEVPRS
jgi:hypothetical protein